MTENSTEFSSELRSSENTTQTTENMCGKVFFRWDSLLKHTQDCGELAYHPWTTMEATEAAIEPTGWQIIIVIIISSVLLREYLQT